MINTQVTSFGSPMELEALFRQAAIGILVLDHIGHIITGNPFIEKTFGYNISELVGQPVNLILPKTTWKEHKHFDEDLRRLTKDAPAEVALNLFARRKDGTKFPAEITFQSYKLSERQSTVAFVTDLSERINAEKIATQKEKEYHFLFEGIQESFILQKIIRDANGAIIDLQFLEINPATEKLLGRPKSEIIGHTRSEFFGPLENELIEIIIDVEKTQKNVRYQQYISKIGRWFDRSIYLYKPDQLITFSTDITDQKQYEAALIESRKLLESEVSALAYLNDAGIRLSQMSNLQQGLSEMLEAAIHLTGADKGVIQLISQDGEDLIIIAQKGFTQDFIEYFSKVSINCSSACGRAMQLKRQCTVSDTETDPDYMPHREIAKKSGYRAVQSTPLFDEHGSLIAMISTHFAEPHSFPAHDLYKMELYARKAESMLERWKMYEQLEKTNASLEQLVEERTKELSNALHREKQLSDIKSRFMAIASHEIRTPLTAILSSAALIASYAGEENKNKREKHTNRIKSSVRNLIEVLNDFLSLEKLEQGKIQIMKEMLNLKDLAQDAVEEVSTIMKTGQKLRFTFTGSNLAMQDKNILRNVFLNLLSNAVKYSDENMEIVFTIDVSEDDMIIKVQDQGIGIPEEEQANLFNEFFRAQNALNIQGTGLGLNIVKRYVDLLGGKINFVSRQNGGTTFTIELPVM